MKTYRMRDLFVLLVLLSLLVLEEGRAVDGGSRPTPEHMGAQSESAGEWIEGDHRPTGQGTLTHMALVRRLVERATGEMLAGIPLRSGESLTVIAATSHKLNWLVSDAITSLLSDAGYRIHVVTGFTEGGDLSEPAPAKQQLPVQPAEGREGPPLQDLFEDDLEQSEGDTTELPDDIDMELEDREEAEGEPIGEADVRESDDLLTTLLKLGETTAGPASTGSEESPAAPAQSRSLELTGPVLEFRIVECDVRYVGAHRAYFLGPKRVERAATVDLNCRLMDGETREIRWVNAGGGIAVDEISKGRLPLYESDSFRPEPLREPGALRYVEPVLVAGIVTGLVYLFYTNQD